MNINYKNAKAYVKRHGELAKARTDWFHSLPNNMNTNEKVRLLNEYNRTIYSVLMQNFRNLHNVLGRLHEHEAAVKIQKHYRGHKIRKNLPFKFVAVRHPNLKNNPSMGTRRIGRTPARLTVNLSNN